MSSRMLPDKRLSIPLRLSTALLAFGLSGVSYAAPAGPVEGAPAAVVPLLLDGAQFENLHEVDPAAGINLVEPPEGNYQGEASLSYPIEVPPGRLGLQPRLEVTYASGGGSGWLGVGWDVSVPTITIDTRWGVPRYSATHETETYLHDGRQLTPLAHRGDPVPRAAGDKLFRARIEGEFDRVIRRGTGPAGFWWEVTDTYGTVYSFGKRIDAGGVENAAVLTDDPVSNHGNVFVWALREIRDTHGNTVLFDYERVASTGLAAGLEPGHELYLRSIRYTGRPGEPGPYVVTFQRDGAADPARPDGIIDAVGGFKRVNDELLRRIEVAFEDPVTRGRTVIRSYDFAYVTGAFRKTLLSSITQRGADGAVFHAHAFDYYDEVSSGNGYAGFGPAQTWNTGYDGLGEYLRLKTISSGTVSSGTSDDYGGSVYVGYNHLAPDKTGSLGGSYGYHRSVMDGLLELVDIDGDNLPDKVFRDGDSLFFRPNTSGPHADPATVAFGARVPLPGLRTISEELSQTHAVSGEEHFFGTQALASAAWTSSEQTAYLSDANGDGLTDLVDAAFGAVRFNYRTPAGSQAFSLDSTVTPVPVESGDVDTDGIVDEHRSCRDSLLPCTDDGDCPAPEDGPCVAVAEALIDNFPLLDTVRRWVAPWDGRVAVSGGIALAGSPDCAGYAAADGVRVAIQLNGDELWSARIRPGDDPAAPRDVGNLHVRAGDRIHFRTQSVSNGACDEVAWDPVVEYRNGQAPAEANLLDPYRYSASGDFVLAGRRGARGWMPATGTVRLDGPFRKLGATTDDVTVEVYHGAAGDDAGTLLFSQRVAWSETVELVPTLDIDVLQGEWVLLRVQTDSPIDLTRISWAPRLYYVAPSSLGRLTDDNGDYIYQLNPPYDIDAYPNDSLDAPQEPWVAPHTGTVTATAALPLLPLPIVCPEGPVVFTVKRPGELLAKAVLEVMHCVAGAASVTFPVTRGDEIFFDFSAYGPELAAWLPPDPYEVAVVYDPASIVPPAHGRLSFAVPGVLHGSAYPELLYALPYRGWSAFGYNGNRDKAELPIDEGALEAYQSRRYDEHSSVDARRDPAHPYMPRPDLSVWLGPSDRAWAGALAMSPSRLGSFDVHVPDSGDAAQGPAAVRRSRSFQFVGGGGFLFFAYSESPRGAAWSAGEVDYLDMNGDLFPDVVSGGRIQYTSPRGGLETDARDVAGYEGDDVRETAIWSRNFGLGANATRAVGNAKGKGGGEGGAAQAKGGKPAGKPAQGSENGGQKEALGSFEAQIGKGEFDVDYDLVDVNGDGLPDRVRRAGNLLQAALNLGYRFGSYETWGTSALSSSESEETSFEPGLGYNSGNFGFAGGLSFTDVDGRVEEELIDINGDGLDDRVVSQGGMIRVAINTGSGFAPPADWTAAQGVTSSAVGLGGGAYFSFAIGPLCPLTGHCYIIVNPGGDYARSISRQLRDVRDVDGDGCPDLLETDRDDVLTVSLNSTRRTNLLKSVSRPLGGRITLEYERDGNTYEMPESRWVLAKVTVDDGQAGDGVNEQKTAFAYEGGRSDRWEREFYGYGTVAASLLEPTADGGEKVYRTVTRNYDTTGFYSRGLLLGEATADGAGRKFLETRYTWFLRDIETGDELADPGDDVATVFPELRRTDRLFHEGESAPVKTAVALYEYELQESAAGVTWSNLVRVRELADEGSRDDLQLDVVYFADAQAYIVGRPASLRYSSQGRELRRREMTLEPGTGDVKQARDYLEDGTAAMTDYGHDAYGNTTAATFPPNLRGQRYAVTYGYDDRIFTHLARIADVVGHVSMARHDLRFGVPLLETDISGNSRALEYDGFGRLVSVTGPYESGSGRETVRYVYHHDAAVPWAMASRTDRFDAAGDPIDSVFFADGLARVTQSKRDATVHRGGSGAADRVMVVSGASEYDFAGRTVLQGHPVTEPTGTPGDANGTPDPVEPTRMTFDVLDRLTSLTLPDGSVTRYEYGFGRDRGGTERLLTRATDANGVPREIFRDVRGLIVALKEFDGGEAHAVWTSYDHDPLRRLTAVVDDRGNAVEASYDNMGRRVGLSSPDGGLTETRYDLASNPVERVTANLRLSGGSILHDYDYTRLTAITYPAFPENNVTYTWGPPGAPRNGAGRLIRVADESGVELFAYDPLGEVAERTRTVASDTQGQSPNSPEVYVTRFSYDSWGRLGRLTYPDGEVVTHRYDSGGLLRELAGVKGGNSYSYVQRLEYDKFLDRVYVLYGNGVATGYGYNPRNRCLEVVRSGAGPGRGGLFQDLRMTCDRVGNVTRVRNLAAVASPRWMGGATDYSFTYDALNRLVSAEGLFERPRERAERFGMEVEYDSIHNIAALTREHRVVNPSGKAVARGRTSIAQRYQYTGSGAHAPDRIGQAKIEWDANGNQLSSRAPGRDGRRTLAWDEENRLQAIALDGHTIRYAYDAGGERVIARGPQGETAYVSKYLTVRDREVGLKHVFAGATRVATKLMKQDRPGANPGGRPPLEKDLYFYHADHLGTTTFVTDAQGALFEHREYFPFGGIFVDESSGTRRTPYLFAAQELDEETRLYRFGARYYDPEAALWLSADPTLRASFPGGWDGAPPAGGGVFESRNLNLYGYAAQNPLSFVGSDTPPFSRSALMASSLLSSPEVGGIPSIVGPPAIPYPHLELPWSTVSGYGPRMSGATTAPVRWGVSQLTQDQAQSVEEAPATGALEFEWADVRKVYQKIRGFMKSKKAQPADDVGGGGGRIGGVAAPGAGGGDDDGIIINVERMRRRALSVRALGPVQGGGPDADLDAAPVRRRRAASVP